MTTCAFVEWPEGLEPRGLLWEALRQQVAAARPDILVTNEMPLVPGWQANNCSTRTPLLAASRSTNTGSKHCVGWACRR